MIIITVGHMANKLSYEWVEPKFTQKRVKRNLIRQEYPGVYT